LYASYFLLRQATEEPSMRARFSAVLSIFTYPTVLICYKSIEWWRTQHPGPVITIRGGGGMAPGMEAAAYWNIIPLLLLSIVFVMIRSHQESTQRELDGLRRMAHGI
jgi:heme exporter protein C